ncbi:Nicotinate-nucleotide adenylyltransferase [Buchnera aphidicola (Protaphis terricola)]
MKKIYVIFGGNFDPIHYGHILSAKELAKEFLIDKIILLPNHNPPHRSKTQTSLEDKLKMIKYVTKKDTLFEISLLETKKKKFYTIDTLKKIRLKIGFLESLSFIIGEDNLYSLNLWKNWKKILSYTHLLILPRKTKKNYKLEKWIISNTSKNKSYLYNKPCGYIFFSSISIKNISSTQIRKNFSNGKTSSGLIPKEIEKYIISKNLYSN